MAGAEKISALPHGGSGEDFLQAHYPAAPKPWRDLSTGINPWPYPFDIPQSALTQLPAQSLYAQCRAAAADYFGAAEGNVALFPGSQAAISLLPKLFAPTTVAIVTPGYSEHEAAWRDHALQFIAAENVTSAAAEILVVTNPNNPDGRAWPRKALLQLAETRSARGHWLIVDEAFADIAPQNSVADACAEYRLIALRSFGKFFGLAGVRLGFVLAPADMTRQLETMMGPWSVSGPALEAGCRAYGDRAWQAATRLHLADESQRLRATLDRYGLSNAGGTSLFLLARHPDAASLFDRLCRNGIYVRRFADDPQQLRFGLPAIAADHARLQNVLRDWAQTS